MSYDLRNTLFERVSYVFIFNRCQTQHFRKFQCFSKNFLNFSLRAIFYLIAPHFKVYSCRKTFHYIGYIPCFKSIWWETKEFALIGFLCVFWTTIDSLFWHVINISCHTNFMLHHLVILYCKFKYWMSKSTHLHELDFQLFKGSTSYKIF